MIEVVADVRILQAELHHREFVRRLSARVFKRFGDYETSLPELFDRQWVRTVVAEVGRQAVGFAMYSLEDLHDGEIDLLAIAVPPEWQSRGLGRRLLGHVETLALELVRGDSATVRLTVSEDNSRARSFFGGAGYLPTPRDRGHYPHGQPSLGLRKQLRRELP